MALKQIRRPVNPEPSWSNDLNLNDPAEPWDGTPTKVEPGTGKRDDGFLPDEDVPAQHVNILLNEDKLWIQYFSSMQMMNWWVTEPRDIAASQINSTECVTYDVGVLAWISAGRSDEVASARALSAEDSQTGSNGSGWQEISPTGDAKTWTWAASKLPVALPAHSGAMTVLSHSLPSATANVAEFTGVWNLYSVPGTGTSCITQHEYDSVTQRWIFVGGTNQGVTPQPAIWTQVAPIGGALTPRAAAAVNSTKCECVAFSSATPLIVVAGDGAPFDVWTSTDAVTFTRATPTGIVGGEEARALMYDPTRAVFVLLTDKSCYTSTNGTAWSLQVTYTTGDFAYRCLATDVQGGFYVACSQFSDPRSVRYSTDGGVNWRIKPIPATTTVGTTAPRQIAYSIIDGQFAIANEDNPNQGCLTFSLGLGEALYDVDSNLLFPTVT